MTKQELIARTDYTEDELINLALLFARSQCIDYKNLAIKGAEGIEVVEHYDDLANAFMAIYEERENGDRSFKDYLLEV